MNTINLILDRLNIFIGIWFILGFLIFVGLGIARPKRFAAMFREETFGHKIMLF